MNLMIKSRQVAFNKAMVGGCGVGWERTLGILVGIQEFYSIFSNINNLTRQQGFNRRPFKIRRRELGSLFIIKKYIY